MDRKVAIVTGVSSGIGRATALELARVGYRVFGTVRSAETEVPGGVEKRVLDVRDQAAIEAVIAAILSLTHRIDLLVNNAGCSIVGALEETETRQGQELFDVNFFGAVRVTQAVLPAMRAQRSGRIVFVSSILGFLPAPFMGFYAASKHALEAYSESLDHEVRALGIRAILVQPAYMKTRLDQNAGRAAKRVADYAAAGDRAAARVSENLRNGEDPSIVARTILAALEAGHPRLRYPVGRSARRLARMRSLLPVAMFDRGLRAAFDLDA